MNRGSYLFFYASFGENVFRVSTAVLPSGKMSNLNRGQVGPVGVTHGRPSNDRSRVFTLNSVEGVLKSF